MLEIALFLGCFVGGATLLGSVVWGIFVIVYSIPYEVWRAFYYAKDNPSAREGNPDVHGATYLMCIASNSTKLYCYWITKKPHNITKF